MKNVNEIGEKIIKKPEKKLQAIKETLTEKGIQAKPTPPTTTLWGGLFLRNPFKTMKIACYEA